MTEKSCFWLPSHWFSCHHPFLLLCSAASECFPNTHSICDCLLGILGQTDKRQQQKPRKAPCCRWLSGPEIQIKFTSVCCEQQPSSGLTPLTCVNLIFHCAGCAAVLRSTCTCSGFNLCHKRSARLKGPWESGLMCLVFLLCLHGWYYLQGCLLQSALIASWAFWWKKQKKEVTLKATDTPCTQRDQENRQFAFFQQRREWTWCVCAAPAPWRMEQTYHIWHLLNREALLLWACQQKKLHLYFCTDFWKTFYCLCFCLYKMTLQNLTLQMLELSIKS